MRRGQCRVEAAALLRAKEPVVAALFMWVIINYMIIIIYSNYQLHLIISIINITC